MSNKNKRYAIHFSPKDVWVDFHEEDITAGELKKILSSVPDDFNFNGVGKWVGTLSFSKGK